MNNYFLLAFLIQTTFAFSQNEHMNWHFGNGAGLNFSSGNPVPFAGSMIVTQESCYSVSDGAGNLLFYTNGIDCWDATNTVMPNGSGLLGNISSQCMVIPKPGNPGIYYIFATDAAFSSPSNGLTYSEVDMSLNGGNGDITATKNIQLTASNGEWITAVPHANCVDAWIITHGDSTNSVLMAYHLSAAGVNPVPVVTDLGVVYGTGEMEVGIMKPNRTGDQIVMTRPLFSGVISVIDFDQATGIATATTDLFTSTTNLTYGIEFSRTGNRLYVGEFMNGEIYQYDMTAIDIPASRTLVGNLSVPGEAGQLQIAPNDKIYVNYNVFPSGANFIGAINNPEVVGTGCGFIQNAVSLGAATTINGLPWYYDPSISLTSSLDLGPDSTLCPGTELTLAGGISSSLSPAYVWSDGSTSDVLQVSAAGIYWVECQIGSCATLVDSVVIDVDLSEIHAVVIDTAGCAPMIVNFSATGSAGVSGWNWNLGNGTVIESQQTSFSYTDAGNYTISLTAVSAANCLLEDTVFSHVEVFENPSAAFSWLPQPATAGKPVFFTDHSSGFVTAWQWLANDHLVSTDSNMVFIPETDARLEMTLIVVNEDGCEAEVSHIIPFQDQDLLFVPNAFTPNGDGSNDIFLVADQYGILVEMTLYNRWGELIWMTQTAAEGWDGTYHGASVPPGVYTWKIKTALDGVAYEHFQGHVVLMR